MSPASPNTLPLKDIHLPPAVGAWPPAPGWWISAVVLIATIAAISFFVIRHRRRNAYRRAALQVAKHFNEHFHQHQDKTQLAIECSELLRRVAVTAYGTHAAGISGARWLQFLDEKFDAKLGKRKSRNAKSSASVFRDLEPALLQAPYRPGVDYDAQALQHALLQWIRHHKVSYTVSQRP